MSTHIRYALTQPNAWRAAIQKLNKSKEKHKSETLNSWVLGIVKKELKKELVPVQTQLATVQTRLATVQTRLETVQTQLATAVQTPLATVQTDDEADAENDDFSNYEIFPSNYDSDSEDETDAESSDSSIF